ANSIRYTRFKLETLLNIDLMSTERSAKVISMASVNKNEGKTFSASNLAYALSVTDNKVLIMDVDFSKPEQSKYFPDAVETPELEIVNSETRINFKRKKVSRNLHIIDTHRISENLCDYVESAVFKSFLEDLKSEYDIIIIDSPPINGHLEPFLLAQYSDFVIFVTNQRKTIKDDFKRALKTFRDTYNGPILGILNFTYDDLKGAIAERKDAA
ncbi:MAG: AAA family ATPase, partial [Bdellovibrionales bacterium]|nr:AAA family ATPase [Bdellovibrionales bacterium]